MAPQDVDLFEHALEGDPAYVPLPERMRPRGLDDVVGQRHLLGEGQLLRRLIEADKIPSMVLWGPPGTGKTTLARLMARHCQARFETLSATSSGVKDIRAAVERARTARAHAREKTIIFIDEIHRFNKSQQDALLPHVEAGIARLVGATTENPSFEVNAALLSRARVFRLHRLEEDDIVALLRRAVGEDQDLASRGLSASEDALSLLSRAADGDARQGLHLLEVCADLLGPGERAITLEHAQLAAAGRALRYDRAGEEHFNLASALIKSLRASQADASVYWLTRMLEAGEDPMFLARRLVIFASEDVGNADPQALVVASAAASATHLIGLPEASLSLTQAAIYLATAPKSNAVLRAYGAARRDVREHGSLEVPMAIRNAATALMKNEGYGKGYRYPHDLAGGVDPTPGAYLPEALHDARYVPRPGHGFEAQAFAALEARLAAARTSGDDET